MVPMSRVGPKGQVVLPKAVRDALGITAGDRVLFTLEDNRVVMTPVGVRTVSELRGILRVDRPVDLKAARQGYQDYLVDRFKEERVDAECDPR